MYIATFGYVVITTYNECAIVQVGPFQAFDMFIN